MAETLTLEDIQAAQTRIAGAVYRTPLVRLPLAGDAQVYAKAENLQRTNSFKMRGAYNFLASLPAEVRARGVTAYSSGNHAQGVACAAHLFGVPAAIAIPEGAPVNKVERTAAWGAEIVRCGGSARERQAAVVPFVEQGYTLVKPFDDHRIIAGQGTVGLEILEDLPDVANVLVCVGGGGLLAGIALAVKSQSPATRVIGVEPEQAADVAESFARGERVEWAAEKTTSTIADGARTQCVGELNFPIIQTHVDAFITVPDAAIIEATGWYLREAKLSVEPTGAMTLAAYWQLLAGATEVALRPGKTVLIVSGGNVEMSFLQRIL